MNLIGDSKVLNEVIRMGRKAARTSSTILIRGESGTGKELLAQLIHSESGRSGKPFVKVNCGAIPATLLESELFGHEQGSFTGAYQRKIGKFEKAHGGTLFLDEIGDLPRDMQVKLLRVLQSREFERLGGLETKTCDVRIVAATNLNLEKLMKDGDFREDLFYRLNVIPIEMPALRIRKSDVPTLVHHFIKKKNQELGTDIPGVDERAMAVMVAHEWPGNVRELENLIERILALSEGGVITLADLPPAMIQGHVFQSPTAETLINMSGDGNMPTLEAYEREIISAAMKRYPSYNAAGKALGITHKTVAFKARKYNIHVF